MPVDFGPPSDDLSQGDLFARVPSTYVEDLRYLEQTSERTFALRDEEPPTRRPDRTYPANATEARGYAIVLTHDCEVDKQTRRALIQLALVRPLVAPAVPNEHHDGFRENRRHRAFYLPLSDYLKEESYADLRRVTTVRGDTLLELERVASMNEDGRRMLREHLFRFFTRRYLPDQWVDWEEDL